MDNNILIIRKIKTESSNNEWWALFRKGDIAHPIVLLNECEMQELIVSICLEAKDVMKNAITLCWKG